MKAVALCVALVLVACGPRPNKEERRSTYGPPKNAQEAAVRWPGEKIEFLDAEGKAELRLRRRTRRTRIFGPRIVPLGDVRQQGAGYVITGTDGATTMRVEQVGDGEDPGRSWRVCAGASPEACGEVIATVVPGPRLEIRQGDAAQATASPEEAGFTVSTPAGRYEVTQNGPGRFSIAGEGDGPQTVTGAGTPLSVVPALAGDLSPLVKGALVVVIEDHHGTWSLNP